MDCIFTLENFNGPLDLLLHLIKQENMDIYEVKIEKIIDQYLNYIENMKTLNLNIASSYLVMAAELIEMKANMLLPKPEISEDEYEDDPKENLIKRLIEYQNYKEVVEKLKIMEQDRHQYYTKTASDISNLNIKTSLPDDLDLNKLLASLQKFLEKKEETKPLNTKITSKEYSVKQRSKEILVKLKGKNKLSFNDLFEEKNKSFIIVTFLSILILVKDNKIIINQENNFDNIMISEVGYDFSN